MTAQALVEQAITLSTADGCVVLVEDVDSANLRWANNTMTTNGVRHRRRVTVVSTVAGRSGTSVGVLSRTGVDEDTVADLVLASETAARAAGPAADARPLIAGAADDSWAEPPARTSIGVFADVTPALGEVFGAARADNRLLFGYAEHEMRTTYLGTSAGLRRRHAQPTGSILLNAKSRDFTRSSYQGAPTSDFADIDVLAMNDTVTTQLGWAERQVELPAGRYETLLPPAAMADLMGYAYFAGGSARDAADGRSVFSGPNGGTRIGAQLCGDVRVTVSSDPHAAGMACAPFVLTHASSDLESVFDDGLPLAPTDWIRDGELVNLITTRHTAEQTGLPVTPYIDNLAMHASTGGSDRTLAEMVAGTERGLLLTCLWYVRMVDPQSMLVTGLTRDGVYLVEHGEVVGAVNNFRFNESPVELLHRISEAGRPERCFGREFGEYQNRLVMPTLRIGDFNMSSVSQAL